MPTYSIQFWAFEAREIRSGDDVTSGIHLRKTSDTIYCGVGIVKSGDPANLRTGPGGNQVHAQPGLSNTVALVCNPVNVANSGNEECTIVWSAMNYGATGGNEDAVMRASLDALAGKVGAVQFGAAPGSPNDLFADDTNSRWLDLADDVSTAAVGNLITQNDLPGKGCDGWVCGGALTLRGDDLFNRTANAPLNIYVLSHGYDSPGGCGDNSLYQSQVIVTRTG